MLARTKRCPKIIIRTRWSVPQSISVHPSHFSSYDCLRQTRQRPIMLSREGPFTVRGLGLLSKKKQRHTWGTRCKSGWEFNPHSNVPEHVGVDGCQPVAVWIRVVVARPSAMTLDEWHLAKMFKAWAGRHQRLGGAFGTSTCLLVGRKGDNCIDHWEYKYDNTPSEFIYYHDEWIATPERIPASGTFWCHSCLTVDRYDVRGSFTHRAPKMKIVTALHLVFFHVHKLKAPVPPADVGGQSLPCHGNHGGKHRCISG